MQIWNTYRNRAISYWLQKNNINIVPNVSWGDERSYDFCFEGISTNSNVAISTNGCIKDKIDRYYFKKGLEKMISTLKPKTIINYSYMPDDIFGEYRNTDIEFIHIPYYLETLKKGWYSG